MARTVRQIRKKGKRAPMAPIALATVPEVDTRVALTQALIPVGLEAFHVELQRKVVSLVGERYARSGRQPGLVRWTPQAGSIYLGDQKLPITVPRVRERQQNREVPLTTYQQFQAPRQLDTGLTYDAASHALTKVRHELRLLNASALASLEEGLEETLTLHRLGVFRELGISLRRRTCSRRFTHGWTPASRRSITGGTATRSGFLGPVRDPSTIRGDLSETLCRRTLRKQ